MVLWGAMLYHLPNIRQTFDKTVTKDKTASAASTVALKSMQRYAKLCKHLRKDFFYVFYRDHL